jgi:hypothetical protein
MINSSDCFSIVVNVTTPWGGEDLYLADEAELARYQSDPDAFAAAHFKLTKAEYREWVTGYGTALCAGTTRHGSPCGNTLRGGGNLSSSEWKRRHRHEFCKTHSVQQARITASASAPAAQQTRREGHEPQ